MGDGGERRAEVGPSYRRRVGVEEVNVLRALSSKLSPSSERRRSEADGGMGNGVTCGLSLADPDFGKEIPRAMI